MGDIGRRISRYRLARYAPDGIPLMRRLRIVWLVAVVWLAWAALISEHSFYRTWRLDADARDPAAERVRAERQLREQHGMAKPGEIIYMIQPRGADTLAN